MFQRHRFIGQWEPFDQLTVSGHSNPQTKIEKAFQFFVTIDHKAQVVELRGLSFLSLSWAITSRMASVE